ncbi:MAG: nitroreductase family protein, partial [Bacteroidaceae bacterium]
LPNAERAEKMTLMDALMKRESLREFDSLKYIPDNVLSDLLWAACGVNRPESKKITAPSAINAQDICVYVCGKDGAWLYDAFQNTLTRVSDKDLRKAVAGRQASVAYAPLFLVLVSDKTKFGNLMNKADIMGAIDAGYVSQNICLACTAMGLATVPRMTMDNDVLKKELKLDDTKTLLLNHPVGYKKSVSGDIPFVVMQNYFVKNTVKEDLSLVEVSSEEDFEKLFGTAAYMGENGQPTAIDFNNEFVIGVIGFETWFDVNFVPIALKKLGDSLEISYKIVNGNEKRSFSIRPSLLIKVDKKYKGKVVGKIVNE